MASMKHVHLFRRYLTIALTLFQSLISCLFNFPILIKITDSFLSLYFLVFCDLRPVTVDLDDGETTVHFWISGHRRISRPNLVMLHGYGGNSKWQFVHQVSDLSKSFNLFIPDLVFFGKSYTKNADRSVEIQARSIAGGLKKLGCDGTGRGRISVYSISYGGFVAYKMAEMWPEMMEKLVIVSSGVGFTQQQKTAEMRKHGGDCSKMLVPKTPVDLRMLVKISTNTGLTFVHWIPDFILSQFIAVMYENNRQELLELAKNLLEREEAELHVISQKTLIVWGDKDKVFPLEHGYRLQRHLQNSRLEIIKETGHAVNVEAPKLATVDLWHTKLPRLDEDNGEIGDRVVSCKFYYAMETEHEENYDEIAATNHSIRGKKDIAWSYVTQSKDSRGKQVLECEYCHKKKLGGGINRMKHHLAGMKGDTDACTKVPSDVRYKLLQSLKETESKKRKNIQLDDSNLDGTPVQDVEDVDTDDIIVDSGPSQKRKQGVDLHAYFKRGVHDPTPPTIKACMQSKERIHDVNMSVALWFYDACIPMNAVNSPFFQPMINKVANMGHGYAGPTYHALRVGLLCDAKLQVSLIVDKFRSTWAATGCTLMADGWKDTRHRPLVNFLVYCPKGITFLKSVDISDICGSVENLCNLFADVVGMIGPENVVHLVTDSAPNYKAAGRLLSEKFPTIAWSPCAAHCINLILEDVGKLPMVHDLKKRMSKVTIFVYNHKWPLSFLRKRPGWREIIRPGETRFATSFIALQSLYQHKDDLQALVTSTDPEFKKLSKTREVKSIVLDERAWNNCLIIVKIMTPIIRLLRICDADEKPSLPYVYEGMYLARLGIKKMFDKKPLYQPYTDIIDKRWDRMLRRHLHAAAYYLNPSFIYSEDTFSDKPEIMGGLMSIFEKETE
ncbi:unnamed protein product [Brassica oleracea]